jgi:LysM repeat protein
VSLKKNTQEVQAVEQKTTPARKINWIPIISWGVTVLLVASLVMVLFKINPFKKAEETTSEVKPQDGVNVSLPAYQNATKNYSLVRLAEFDTAIPNGIRQYPIKYTIQEGDSIFSIAKEFKLKPESILWANYDLLNDDPTFLSPGWRLTIPPTDGIYYKWKKGDTLEKVAEKYYSSVDDIISWPSNRLDITLPNTDNLDYVMIPNGYRELVSWIVPLPFAPRSGATRIVAGPGGCQAPATGYVGSTAFGWPVSNHFLSGFDFSSYHLGIDIAAAEGTPIHASDAGTVIYSGWNDSGYGYMVEIDHNNGYQTLYGHMSYLSVACGQQVGQGQTIGAAGSTGRSTGAHVHFEVRFNGGFVNPWQVLGY